MKTQKTTTAKRPDKIDQEPLSNAGLVLDVFHSWHTIRLYRSLARERPRRKSKGGSTHASLTDGFNEFLILPLGEMIHLDWSKSPNSRANL